MWNRLNAGDTHICKHTRVINSASRPRSCRVGKCEIDWTQMSRTYDNIHVWKLWATWKLRPNHNTPFMICTFESKILSLSHTHSICLCPPPLLLFSLLLLHHPLPHLLQRPNLSKLRRNATERYVWFYACMCVCTWVYVCVQMCVVYFVYVCNMAHFYVGVHTNMCVCVYMCVCVSLYVSLHVCACYFWAWLACTCKVACLCVGVCIVGVCIVGVFVCDYVYACMLRVVWFDCMYKGAIHT